jgi:L-ascorbate metabolism protein UlaG (beta-lactamase superfamily)
MADVDGTKILFDPFISENEAAKDIIDMAMLMPDYILVTHGHFDHICDVEAIAKQSGAAVIANFEVANYFGQKGLKTIPVNQGGTVSLKGMDVKAVNAIHSSSFPDGGYAGNPLGFVIHGDGAVFYYSGDTALTYDMKLIAEQYQLDFAFLCLGDCFTMGVEDALKASDFVGTQEIIGMHFDTFEPITIDHDEAIKIFEQAGKLLKLPEIGETFTVECAINRDEIKKNYG